MERQKHQASGVLREGRDDPPTVEGENDNARVLERQLQVRASIASDEDEQKSGYQITTSATTHCQVPNVAGFDQYNPRSCGIGLQGQAQGTYVDRAENEVTDPAKRRARE